MKGRPPRSSRPDTLVPHTTRFRSAGGRGGSGAQAKGRGLVDAFGGLLDAIDDAATRAELGEESDYRVRYIEKMATPFQRFFTGFTGSRLGGAWLRQDRKRTRLNSSH